MTDAISQAYAPAPTQASPAAGWYPDQAVAFTLRWWDGAAWTSHTAPMAPASATADRRGAEHWLVPTGRTWQAIAAGYVGIVALFIWFVGPVALGFGVWALRATSRSGARGKGRAIFAIVVGAVTSLLGLSLILDGM